ncbi:centromere protein C isoform X2 [Malaclemys terrapin pileata]|uniref:centromere protein C isoform X2 n=1 Tax=Malaclemys terrapin pileata TaxID=2991368 RepID=UPI0023A7BE78|nr:centromere protein C isoform X2 [Malaclemys terrapin pileata]
MAEPLNHLKNDYRARFCSGGGKQQINVQPGQNVLKIIRDCFENCVSDSTINSPSITHCSTPVILKQKEDLLLSKELNSGLFNSVKKIFKSTSSVDASPVKSISCSGQSTGAHQKSIALGNIVSSDKKEQCVLKEDTSSSEDELFDANDPVGSNKKANSILEAVERSSQSPAGIFDTDEDNYEVIGSPVLLVEEAETSVHLLSLDEKATPAMMKRQTEVQRSEGPLARTEEQIVPVERANCVTVPSEQKKKSLSSAFLVALTTGAVEKRYSASIPPPPPSPVKDLGMENECEFLIDESDGFSFTSWFSIPKKNKKIEKQALSKPEPQSQPSEKKKAVVQESKKRKDRKAQNEVPVKLTRMEQSKMKTCDAVERIQAELQNASDTNLGLADKKREALKSVRQSSPHMESKKHTHGQRSTRTPNKKNSTALKQIQPKKFTFSVSKSDTDISDTEQPKPTEIPNGDPFGSCSMTEQPQEKVVSSEEDHNFPKPPPSILKTALRSSHKKQTAKQKLSKIASSKKLVENRRNKVRKSTLKSSSRKSRIQISEESSESESIEEVAERELLKSNKVFAPSLQQESPTSALQKSHKFPKPKNFIHSLESSGNVHIKTPAKSKKPSQIFIDNTEDSQGKRASAKSLRRTATRINQRTNMIDCSNPENAEPGNTTDHKGSSGQDMAEQNHKKSNASVKTKYKKQSNLHRSQVSPAPEKNKNHNSGLVLKRYVKFTSKNDEPIACEWEDSSSDKSIALKGDASEFLSNTPLKHKLVMPSQTPNVRRTKRIRLKPLEYWRGERVNYMMRPSGGFVVGGIVSPEKDPCKKASVKRKHTPKTRHHVVEYLNISLADTSKPTTVWDPTINEEVLLECVNTGRNHSCFFNDESVEIYKNLNTSVFAAGKLILKPLKEKGHQFVYTDNIAFHVIRGKIIFTLHKTSYYLTTGDFFYVPEGNGYNIRNLLNEESILLFTQLKGERPIIERSLNESSSP